MQQSSLITIKQTPGKTYPVLPSPNTVLPAVTLTLTQSVTLTQRDPDNPQNLIGTCVTFPSNFKIKT